jgi:hypothetical protein
MGTPQIGVSATLTSLVAHRNLSGATTIKRTGTLPKHAVRETGHPHKLYQQKDTRLQQKGAKEKQKVLTEPGKAKISLQIMIKPHP